MLRRGLYRVTRGLTEKNLAIAGFVTAGGSVTAAALSNPILRGALAKFPAAVAEKPGYAASLFFFAIGGGLLANYWADRNR